MGSILNFTSHEFERSIETIVVNKKITYIDAILEFCEKHELDPESIAGIITKPIKEKIEYEGEEINILKKRNRLAL